MGDTHPTTPSLALSRSSFQEILPPPLSDSGKLSQGLLLRTQMLTAISVNKDVPSHGSLLDSEPWGTRDGDKLPTAKPIRQAAAAESPMVYLWGDAGWENRGYRPQGAKVHIKGVISVSPDSYLLWFFSLRLTTWSFVAKTSVYLCLPPCLFGAIKSYSSCCLLGLKS